MFKNLSALFAVVAALNFTACQKNADAIYNNNADTAKILGGEVVQPSDIVANSTVALKYIEGNRAYPMCTGTLISPNLVLTASHCLRGMNKNALRIGFSIDVKNQLDVETMYEVADFVTHPKYGSSGRLNDVALIALAKPAPAPYKPVGIISDKYKLAVGMPMLLAGYGVTNDLTGADTEALRKVTVPMAKILDADAILVTDQTKASGACNGDSGGPAYLEKDGILYVYGITRGPHDSAPDCHHFGEYTYASKFETFILETAAKLKTEAPSFVVPQ
ncbi:MAG: serine protease [Pseudobdellovibrio sp.]|nr:serine protease [Pseudobdellovibrio sp.]